MKAFLRIVLGVFAANLLLFLLILSVIAWRVRDEPEVRGGSVLVQDLAGAVPEFAGPGGLPFDLDRTQHHTAILENLEKARHDRRIHAVVLRIASPSVGWAKMDEWRERIAQLREAGKPVFAYTEILDRPALYIGAACDSLFMMPNGYTMLHGFAAERPHFAGALEKLGVRENLHRIEAYKSAAEMFQRRDMSPESRENMTWMIDAMYDSFVRTVEAERGLSSGTIEGAVFASGALVAEEARDLRLVDRLMYWDELEAGLLRLEDVQTRRGRRDAPDARPRVVDGREYARVERKDAGIRGRSRIAVIHAQGLIQGENNGTSFPFGMTMGARTMEQAFREAAEDRHIAAVIYRVDSPGGESATSWMIQRAALQAGLRKPIIVSMVDVAASGGYLISYPVGTLVAGRMSVVGSIGSISGKFNVRGLYDKLGITKDFVTRGPNALMYSDYFDFTPEQLEAFTDRHWRDYNLWVEDIARARGKTFEEIDAVGRGRVWTGEQALEHGLIDSVGTFDTAVRIAKERADISLDAEVRFVHLPKRPGFLEALRAGGLASLAHAVVERIFKTPRVQQDWAVETNRYW